MYSTAIVASCFSFLMLAAFRAASSCLFERFFISEILSEVHDHREDHRFSFGALIDRLGKVILQSALDLGEVPKSGI